MPIKYYIKRFGYASDVVDFLNDNSSLIFVALIPDKYSIIGTCDVYILLYGKPG